MIEPTESENLEELIVLWRHDCNRKEIESATIDNPNNVLKNAPHTLMMVTANDWVFHIPVKSIH
jgi:glycine dehydrogenase